MIKKAISLKSLDELELKQQTRNSIQDKPLIQIVAIGRHTNYHLKKDPKAKFPKWRQELSVALDKAGFIRHDIDDKTLNVGKLYKCAFREYSEEIVGVFEDLLEPEKYENFQPITKGQFEAVKFALKGILSEREYEVIILWFGLKDGKTWPREAIAFQLGLPVERIRQTIAKSIRKITTNRSKLPHLFYSDIGEESVNNLIRQLNILHKDPIFKREAELRAELREFSHSPFTYAEKATAYLVGRNATDLDKLSFSVNTYNCLRRAGIDTISDVIDYPQTEWPKIRNVSEKILKEVERKMKAFGLSNFEIPYKS